MKEANPWEKVALSDYENHMKLAGVYQLQTLDSIMGAQFGTYPIHSVAILGVAGGNGLGHFMDFPGITSITGIDINPDYLAASAQRHPQLAGRYKTLLADIRNEDCALPQVDMVVANLFIEYVGCRAFALAVSRMTPKYVSCVIQIDVADSFVSDSPYTEKLEILDSVHAAVDSDELIGAMEAIGYKIIAQSVTPLPNGKQFKRLDFSCSIS